MMVIQQEGGLGAGVFRDDDLLAYVIGFPKRNPAMQHSHRLAVLPHVRGIGWAAALKLFQHDWCLKLGIAVVRGTHHPMRHANASLNIARRGAIVQTYYADFCGAMEGINKGAPSDHLLTEWNLAGLGVVARAGGGAAVLSKHDAGLQFRKTT